MKTYLPILENSEGSSPSEIKSILLNMGLKVTKGNYDFVYEWNEESRGIEELVWFTDKVHSAFKRQ